jgi:hypothetical protein
MTKQELIQAVKEVRDICCNAGETNTWDIERFEREE